jgi:hypothetical protein
MRVLCLRRLDDGCFFIYLSDGYGERMARSVVSKLVERGLLVSSSPKGPVRLGFPLTIMERWFPSLYSSNRI